MSATQTEYSGGTWAEAAYNVDYTAKCTFIDEAQTHDSPAVHEVEDLVITITKVTDSKDREIELTPAFLQNIRDNIDEDEVIAQLAEAASAA